MKKGIINMEKKNIMKKILIATGIVVIISVITTIGIGNYFVNYAILRMGNGGDRGRRYHRAALWAGGGSGKYHCGGETSGLQQWRDFERGQLLQ